MLCGLWELKGLNTVGYCTLARQRLAGHVDNHVTFPMSMIHDSMAYEDGSCDSLH